MRPAYHLLNRRGGGGPRSPIECGRKHCAGCGRWRHVCDFALHHGVLRARCRTCQRIYQRNWHANATPEQRARIREYLRIWDDAKRRERGARKNNRRRPSVIDQVEGVYLEPTLLVAKLNRHAGELDRIAALAGISERQLRRYRNGESARIRIDIADRIAVALGLPLALLYKDR